jgi:hypothetical protein
MVKSSMDKFDTSDLTSSHYWIFTILFDKLLDV